MAEARTARPERRRPEGTRWASLRERLPSRLRAWLAQHRHLRRWPPLVRFGSLRRLAPIDGRFGFSRGLPVDRWYIERFLARNAGDIHGRVLEAGEDLYTSRFGAGRVTRVDVLVRTAAERGTIVADLERGAGLPAAAFDAVVLTQTLQMIYDVRAAVGQVHRALRPGGVALVTASGISKLSTRPGGAWEEQWHLTPASARRLFADVFGDDAVTVSVYGNVLAAVAFLHGVAAAELTDRELVHQDPDFPVVVAVRAVKRRARSRATP
jgi:SAM-dependent methyltransferase